ncbi:MAG: hypothetical protein IPK82_03660 [Polyangiaceae bacterium]|nr:hypothetical protein [Polyangiaceae bacterium]
MARKKTAPPTKKATPQTAKKPAIQSPKKTALQTTRQEAVKVREADRKRAESLLALIGRRTARIAEDFFDIGKALRELLQKKLYLALGYTSFEEMLTARKVMSLAQAKKLIQVVEAVPIEKALALGPEKAYALARYAAATPELDTPASLLEQGAKVGGKRADQASVRDIERATRETRAKTAPKPIQSAAEKAAAKTARDLTSWLRKLKIKGASVEPQKDKGAFRLVISLPADQAKTLLSLHIS